VAFKIIPKEAIDDPSTVLNEVNTLSQLAKNCEHFVCFVDFLEDDTNFYIITEYLDQYIPLDNEDSVWSDIKPSLKMKIIKQLIDDIVQLHKLGIIHGDIHPGNILLSQKGDIKLIDFGQACLNQTCERLACYYGGPEYGIDEYTEGLQSRDSLIQSEYFNLGITILVLLNDSFDLNSSIYTVNSKNPLLNYISQTAISKSLPTEYRKEKLVLFLSKLLAPFGQRTLDKSIL